MAGIERLSGIGVRLVLFIGLCTGGVVGWWIGSYVGICMAFIVSSLGSIPGLYAAFRLTRDYM